MRRYFAPGTLSFPAEKLVEQSALAFPVVMNIEPSLRCNSNCIMCPRTRAVRPVGDMEFELFRKIAAEMAEAGGVRVCNFHKDGEPLMNPRLEEMIGLAKDSGACDFSHFNTNALLLSKERALRLIECGVDDITMSVDAATEETFALVKQTGSLRLVEGNIERLLELREHGRSSTPWVRVKLCAMEETIPEIDRFVKRWTGIADEVQIQEVHNYGGGNEGSMAGQEGRYPCQFWWSSMAVNWDGTVSVCSVDYSGKVILGDLKRDSIRSIYGGPAYSLHRRAMLSGDYGFHPVCSGCTVWKVGPDQSDWYRRIAGEKGN